MYKQKYETGRMQELDTNQTELVAGEAIDK